MVCQIDQSHKIEQTEKDTVLALSNNTKFTVLLKSKTKRALQLRFRNNNKPEVFIYLVFAALLAILIKSVSIHQRVYIDHEYLGHEDLIKLKLLQIFKKEKIAVDFNFVFVGKVSSAHALASKVATKKMKPNKIVSEKEILDLVLPKQKDRVSQTGPRSA